MFFIKGLPNIGELLASKRNLTFNVYSATLKSERLKKRLTLEDITTNICSKSYLSKIENNLLEGDYNCLKQLFLRVDIDYDDFQTYVNSIDLYKCLQYFLNDENDKIIELYKTIKVEYYISKNSLLKLFYYLIAEDYLNFETTAREIDRVKKSLLYDELAVFILLVFQYYLQTNQYRLLEENIHYFELFHNLTPEMHMLYNFQQFLLACHLNEMADILKYFQLVNKNIEKCPHKKHFYSTFLFLEKVSNSYDYFQNMKKQDIPDEYYEMFQYSFCLCLIRLEKYKRVMDIILESKLYNPDFIALFGFSLYKIKNEDIDKNEYRKYRRIFNELKASISAQKQYQIDLEFIEYISLEIEEADKQKKLAYLKDFIMYNQKLYQHRLYSIFYFISYFNLLGVNARYKEAFLFVKSELRYYMHNILKLFNLKV